MTYAGFLLPWQIRSQGQVAGCSKACAAGGYALTLIGADSSCRCAGSVPPAAALLWDTECEAGGTGVAAFYNHAGGCVMHAGHGCAGIINTLHAVFASGHTVPLKTLALYSSTVVKLAWHSKQVKCKVWTAAAWEGPGCADEVWTHALSLQILPPHVMWRMCLCLKLGSSQPTMVPPTSSSKVRALDSCWSVPAD